MTTAAGEKTFDLYRELILSAEEDYIDLATVIHIVQEALRLTDERDVRDHTLGTVYGLLKDGLLRAGVPLPEGDFETWRGGHKVTSRIASEWDSLGRTPVLGEIVWFDVTARGLSYLGGPRNEN